MKKLIILLLTSFSFASVINIPDDFSTIQGGIDASIDGDTVLVQPGTYYENINFNGHNIVLGSLFLTTAETSYITQTVIDGNQNGSVVIFENGESVLATLSGFTLTNGLSNDGAGIHLTNSSNPTLKNLNIIENYGVQGAGILCNNSNPMVVKTLIANNHSECGMTSSCGGGGVFVWQSNPSFVNCTISHNSTSGTNGANGHAIWVGEGTINLQNSIVWYREWGEIIEFGQDGEITSQYSWIQTITPNSTDPLFVDSISNNFSLQPSSPCIDAGDPESEFDPDGTIADIGAYYYNQYVDMIPLPPSGLIATSGNEQVSLSWDANEEEDLSYYNIFGGMTENSTNLLASLPITGTDYVHENLIPETIYYYRITVVNNNGLESDYSSEVSAIPIQYYTIWTEGGSGSTKIYHYQSDEWESISSPGNSNGGFIDMTYDVESDRVIWINGYSGQTKAYDFNTDTWDSLENPGGSNGVGFGIAYDIESDRVILVRGWSGYAMAYDYNTDAWEIISSPGDSNGQDVALTYNIEVDRVFWVEGSNGNSKAYDYNTDTWENISSPGNSNGDYIAMTYNAKYDRAIWTSNYNSQAKAYDYVLNTWETIESPGNGNGIGIALSYDAFEDRVICTAGIGGGGSAKKYNYNTDQWVNISAPGNSNGQDIAMTFRGAYSPFNGYQGPVWHISTNGSDENDGSADSPFLTIQHGIDNTLDGDTVLVHPGIYFENINFYGQEIYVTSEYHSTLDTNIISQTIIDGGGNDHVVRFESNEGSTSVFRGFTITNGFPFGLYFWHVGNPIIDNLKIVNNGERGVYITQSSPTLKNLTISDHSGPNGGQGIYLGYSESLLDNIIVKDNSTIHEGGGILVSHSNLTMNDIVIKNNSASNGGGIRVMQDSNVIINKALIVNNNGSLWNGGLGGGLFVGGGCNVTLNQATISNNISENGSGIYMQSANLFIDNSIIWSNEGNQDIYSEPFGEMIIYYSDIFGGEDEIIGDSSNLQYENNIESDPLFIDPENENYHLQINSPCIDAGNPENDNDPDGTIADMGAYYFHQISGCMDPLADNYNPDAIIDDGTCTYLEGCTDPLALNYDPDAIVDDGSCIYGEAGCNDEIAYNFNENAQWNDGSCIYYGDINADGSINVVDVIAMVGFVLEFVEPTPEEILLGDLYPDGVINIYDIVGVVSIILTDPLLDTLPLSEVTLIQEHHSLKFSKTGSIAGIQIEYEGEFESSLEGWMIEKNESTILMVSIDGSEINKIYYSGDLKIKSCEVIDWELNKIQAEVIVIPDQFSIKPAFPNPFNPVTTFSYDIPYDAYVVIKAFDVRGKEVVELVNGMIEEGNHEVVWDASKLSSGMYFVRMTSGDYKGVQKIVFLK
jgi:parallel beta-helix repeat protein